jgi:hypothetical protein
MHNVQEHTAYPTEAQFIAFLAVKQARREELPMDTLPRRTAIMVQVRDKNLLYMFYYVYVKNLLYMLYIYIYILQCI